MTTKKPTPKPKTPTKKPVAQKKPARSKVEGKKNGNNGNGFKKGMTKTGGRKKGEENKVTTILKTSIMDAFDAVGGVNYLISVAMDDPKTFCGLLGKILPAEIQATLEHKGNITYVVNTGATNRPPVGVNNPNLKLISKDVSK